MRRAPATFGSERVMLCPLPRVWHPAEHDLAIAVVQDFRAARLALHLLGFADQAVARVGLFKHHFTAGRDLKALFGARFGLHLGHFSLRFHV